jgi:hypothetical protein
MRSPSARTGFSSRVDGLDDLDNERVRIRARQAEAKQSEVGGSKLSKVKRRYDHGVFS